MHSFKYLLTSSPSLPLHTANCFWGVNVYASFSPLEKVIRSQNCHGLHTPSQWQLPWDDYCALGNQVSFISGPTNDIAKNLTLAEVQLPHFCGEKHRRTKSTVSFSIASKLVRSLLQNDVSVHSFIKTSSLPVTFAT